MRRWVIPFLAASLSAYAAPTDYRAGINAGKRRAGETTRSRQVPYSVTIRHYDDKGKRTRAVKRAYGQHAGEMQERGVRFYQRGRLARWVYTYYHPDGRRSAERVIYYGTTKKGKIVWLSYVHTFFGPYPRGLKKVVTIISRKTWNPYKARFYYRDGRRVTTYVSGGRLLKRINSRWNPPD